MGISCRNLSVVETPVECTMISSAVILATTILVVDSINLHTSYQEEFEFSPAQYSFEYGVRDGEVGVNYGQQKQELGQLLLAATVWPFLMAELKKYTTQWTLWVDMKQRLHMKEEQGNSLYNKQVIHSILS